MKQILMITASAIVAGCITAPRYVTGKYEGAAAKVAPKHVVLVGLDGFAGNTFEKCDAPTVKKLAAEGAWTIHSRSILPSSSACNWHSLFTCSASEQHGYIDWNSSEPKFAASATGDNGMYPDLVYRLRRQRPDAEIGFFYDWSGMGHVLDTNACSRVRYMAGTNITDAAVNYIKEKKPDFCIVYFDSPDDAGHGKGWGSPEYLARIKELDGRLKRVLEAIEAAGIADDTMVMVTSDHGGKDRGHGGPTLSEMERIFILKGKGVKRNYEIAFPGAIYDSGATLAAILGIEPPAVWIGRPYDEAFED